MDYDILVEIQKLPKEIINIIYFFVPCKVKVFLNKYNYETLYYKAIFVNIKDDITYIRKIISFDCYFSFNKYLFFLGKDIKNKKTIIYNNKKYKNLFELYNQLCIKYNSTNCRNLLNNYWKQNEHK